MQTLGLCHVALNVENPERTAEFYTEILGMTLEWQPDADNIYLTSAARDNLAIHRAAGPVDGRQRLDHIGFAVASAADVDAWHAAVAGRGVSIAQPPRTHRDGARSFYLRDPDGLLVQIIYHPPIAAQVLRRSAPARRGRPSPP